MVGFLNLNVNLQKSRGHPGASEVVLLDREALALRCALLSAEASGISLSASLKEERSRGDMHGPHEPEPLQGWGQEGSLQTSGAASHGLESSSSSPSSSSAQGRSDNPQKNLAVTCSDNPQKNLAVTCPVSGLLKLPPYSFEGLEALSSLLGSRDSSDGAPPAARPLDDGGQRPYEGQVGSSSVHSVLEGSEGRSGLGNVRGGEGVRARVFDWNHADLLRENFDVLLACDVLYEDSAVEPIARLVPRWVLTKLPLEMPFNCFYIHIYV